MTCIIHMTDGHEIYFKNEEIINFFNYIFAAWEWGMLSEPESKQQQRNYKET